MTFIELDDGKILTGKPDQFDGKNPWVSGSDFPLKTQSSDTWAFSGDEHDEHPWIPTFFGWKTMENP